MTFCCESVDKSPSTKKEAFVGVVLYTFPLECHEFFT